MNTEQNFHVMDGCECNDRYFATRDQAQKYAERIINKFDLVEDTHESANASWTNSVVISECFDDEDFIISTYVDAIQKKEDTNAD